LLFANCAAIVRLLLFAVKMLPYSFCRSLACYYLFMRRRFYDSTTVYCFSPPVMIITCLVELALAVRVLWRYKHRPLTWLAVAALLCLALFQLCEFYVCKGSAMDGWSRLGFCAITLLPPLGLHILCLIRGRPQGVLLGAAYLSAAGFIGYFLVSNTAFSGYACTGNYVIFQLGHHASLGYSLYYYGWLIAALVLGLRGRNQRQVRRRRAIDGLIAGYLVFLVPTAVVSTLNPTSQAGIPSIMCGFAVLFAFILTFLVVPNGLDGKRPTVSERMAKTR
jgi:hypothetical protein